MSSKVSDFWLLINLYCLDEFSVELDNEILSSLHILVNQEENFKPFVETNEQQRNIPNRWTNAIATNMWHDVECVNENEH